MPKIAALLLIGFLADVETVRTAPVIGSKEGEGRACVCVYENWSWPCGASVGGRDAMCELKIVVQPVPVPEPTPEPP